MQLPGYHCSPPPPLLLLCCGNESCAQGERENGLTMGPRGNRRLRRCASVRRRRRRCVVVARRCLNYAMDVYVCVCVCV